MIVEIEAWIALGAVAGVLASLLPNYKFGCAVLCAIPVAMLILLSIELASRPPDALDALLYIFAPLYPSIGAVPGFFLGKAARKYFVSGGGKNC